MSNPTTPPLGNSPPCSETTNQRPPWLSKVRERAAQARDKLRSFQQDAEKFKTVHKVCQDATEELVAQIGMFVQARKWSENGPLLGGLQPAGSHLPVIYKCVELLAAAISGFLEAFPLVRAWWAGINPDNLFDALDAEVWPQRPLADLQASHDDVRAHRRACFDVAWGVVHEMIEGTVSPGLLDIVLNDTALKNWEDYLYPIINVFLQGDLPLGPPTQQVDSTTPATLDESLGSAGSAKVFPVPLVGWQSLFAALNEPHGKQAIPNTDQNRRLILRFNEELKGPITRPGGRGQQPKVEKAALMAWWSGPVKEYLNHRRDEGEQKDESAQLTTAETHNFGRDAIVVPEIGGHVRKSRKKK